MTSITKMHGIMNRKYMIGFDLQMMRSGGKKQTGNAV